MQYSIYPSIGIARVGNDLNEFYIGPEIPGHPGFESDGQTVVKKYKVDEDQIKRQAARFRIFEIPDANSAPRPASLPAGATVEWTVHLVNKKAAVVRGGTPPAQPQRPELAANSAERVIDPNAQTIAGANAAGVKFDTGEFMNRRVPLGELRTDQEQNLLVLGGFGFSSSPNSAPLPSFYSNPGWHDDVSDGPVTARIRLPDGSTIANITPAWAIVGPPDFAPEILGVVTLYDIMLQVGIDSLGLQGPAQVSFTNHVFPLLQRTRRLRWVNEDPNWSDISDDWPSLATASAAASQLRRDNAELVRNIESVLSHYKLTSLQQSFLNEWVVGNFLSDWTGVPQPESTVTPAGLTRAALDSTVGQGFFPGIEGGILVKDPNLYGGPFDFRLDHNQVHAGDLTALMAVPWQADFLDCLRGWWPSQRPDDVRLNPTATTTVRWERGVSTHIGMVNNFSRLGFITAQKDAQGNIVFAEDQRAPGIQFV
ncbi:MAG TPA: hypothetical protein DC047_14510 [Blastocatellia bacterium]|nr:hypothetical protein [Blastocatellia bacterium]